MRTSGQLIASIIVRRSIVCRQLIAEGTIIRELGMLFMRSVLVSLYDNVIQPFIARTEK